MKTTSLKPPIPFSLTLTSSVFQRLRSAKRTYIRYSSDANNAASSPPAPARISTITFFSSFGSFGRSRIFNSCSSSSMRFFAAFNSSFAISRISSSDSSSRSARLSSTSCFAFLYSLYASTIGARSDCSFISLRKRFVSLATSGLPSSSISSS